MKKYNFDQVINRESSGALKCDALQPLFGNSELTPLWVADLDFAVGSGGENMFTDCSSYLVIYVPMGSVDAYKVAINWRDYSSKIQGKDF